MREKKKPKLKRFRNFMIVAHWRGHISHIEEKEKYFIGDIKTVPLDKKKYRLKKEENNDGIVEIPFSDIPKKDQSKITLGHIFDWYLGWSYDRYAKDKRKAVSKIVFMKKYGDKGKRINMKEVERRVKHLMENIKWG